MSEKKTCEYQTEILNRRKLIKAMETRIWQILAGALVVALLFAGITYFVKHIMPGEKQYQSESSIYVEFVKGENEPVGWICYTADAWHVFFASDDFTADVLESVDGLTEEQYRKCLEELDLVLADGRVLNLTIRDTDMARAKAVNEAMLSAIDEFGKTQDRIGFTRVLIAPKEAELIVPKDRTVRAGILGFIVGLACFVLWNVYRLLRKDEMYSPCPVGQKE